MLRPIPTFPRLRRKEPVVVDQPRSVEEPLDRFQHDAGIPRAPPLAGSVGVGQSEGSCFRLK